MVNPSPDCFNWLLKSMVQLRILLNTAYEVDAWVLNLFHQCPLSCCIMYRCLSLSKWQRDMRREVHVYGIRAQQGHLFINDAITDSTWSYSGPIIEAVSTGHSACRKTGFMRFKRALLSRYMLSATSKFGSYHFSQL